EPRTTEAFRARRAGLPPPCTRAVRCSRWFPSSFSFSFSSSSSSSSSSSYSSSCVFGCDAEDAIQHYLLCVRLQHHVCLPRSFAHGTVLERLGPGGEDAYATEDMNERLLWSTTRRLCLSYYMFLELKNSPGGWCGSYSANTQTRPAALDRFDLGGNVARATAVAARLDTRAAHRGQDAYTAEAPNPAVHDGHDYNDISDAAVADGHDNIVLIDTGSTEPHEADFGLPKSVII
ncbi:unnamed protein product, partial [Prorocentrum cordatum]